MRTAFAFAMLAISTSSALSTNLTSVKDARLAGILGLLKEISPSPRVEQPLLVRVYTAPVVIGECDGTVRSCPDVRLFITVSSGDLGETPTLYELPIAKGWEFTGWSSTTAPIDRGKVAFTVRTALPESNIETSERENWRSKSCRVEVSSATASYVCE